MTTRAHVYPLQIEELVDPDGEILAVWSKGHHPAGSALARLAGDPFLADALHYLDRLGRYDPDTDQPPDSTAVQFETWRCVPTRGYYDADWSMQLLPARHGRPGAFPVTVLHLDALDLDEDPDGQASEASVA